jgi:hypothetical protein
LKRQEIIKRTRAGLAIEKLLELEHPLPAELGYFVTKGAIRDGLNVISGYPISIDEFNLFSIHALMIGILVLSADEKILVQRFNSRSECPQCHMPGVVGDLCPIHKIPMIQRTNINPEEFATRRKLYRRRIKPFLKSKCVKNLPKLMLDSGTLTKNEIVYQAKRWIRWIRQLTIENGGIK